MPVSNIMPPAQSGVRRWTLRFFAATGLLTTVLIVMAAAAPKQSRWLVARTLEHLYDLAEPPRYVSPDVQSHRGLTNEQATTELHSSFGGTWRVNRNLPEQGNSSPLYLLEDPGHPSVAAFRRETEDLVPEPFDVFEVARRIRATAPHAPDLDAAVDIWPCLQAARERRGLLCCHFSRLLATVCASRGYSARLIGLSATGESFDHALCEIFLPEHGGWIVIDTDFSLAYQRNGKWLNTIEIQDVWRAVRHRIPPEDPERDSPAMTAERRESIVSEFGIRIVEFGAMEENLRTRQIHRSPSGMNLEMFEYIFIAARNDFLSREYPPGHPVKIGQFCFRSDASDNLIKVCPEANYAARSWLYAPVGTTAINVIGIADKDVPSLKLQFAGNRKFCQRFEVRSNHGEWQAVADADHFVWQFHPGLNALEVRSANAFGIHSMPSTMQVQFDQNDDVRVVAQ